MRSTGASARRASEYPPTPAANTASGRPSSSVMIRSRIVRRIPASDRATCSTTGRPETFEGPLRTRKGTVRVGTITIRLFARLARSPLVAIGCRSATAVRYSSSPSGLQTCSHGLSSSSPVAPSNHVSDPSGFCSAISVAQRKSPRKRLSSDREAPWFTNQSRHPA